MGEFGADSSMRFRIAVNLISSSGMISGDGFLCPVIQSQLELTMIARMDLLAACK